MYVGSESNEASLHKIFASYELLRRKNGELAALFRVNFNKIYVEIIIKKRQRRILTTG